MKFGSKLDIYLTWQWTLTTPLWNLRRILLTPLIYTLFLLSLTILLRFSFFFNYTKQTTSIIANMDISFQNHLSSIYMNCHYFLHYSSSSSQSIISFFNGLYCILNISFLVAMIASFVFIIFNSWLRYSFKFIIHFLSPFYIRTLRNHHFKKIIIKVGAIETFQRKVWKIFWVCWNGIRFGIAIQNGKCQQKITAHRDILVETV